MEKFNRNGLFVIFLLIGILWAYSSIAQNFALNILNTGADSFINKDDTINVSVKSPTGAMIRSMIIPGWGQLYNKKIFKAMLIFCAETGLIANSIYLNQKYKASKTELEREFYINNRNLSNWWLVGVILFSMADAFVDAHLSDFDESSNLSFLNINPVCTNAHTGIQLSICLNF